MDTDQIVKNYMNKIVEIIEEIFYSEHTYKHYIEFLKYKNGLMIL